MTRSRGWLAQFIDRRAGGANATVLDRNIRINTMHGVAQVMAMNMVLSFTGIFAVKLGATNYQIALLSSGPAVVSLLAMIPGAQFINRHARKKRITMAFLMAHRTFYLALACLPFFNPDRRAAILVAIVALMNLPGAIGNISWQSFISGIIPPHLRPTAFAERNRMMNLIGTLVVLVTGRLLDLFSFPMGYQIVFAIAFCLAIVERYVLSQIDEEAGTEMAAAAARAEGIPTGSTAARRGGSAPQPPTGTGLLGRLVANLRGIFANTTYARFTLASIFFYFCWQVPWPLFTLYQVRVLGANNLWISILNLTNTGGSLVGYGFWARYANRNGNLRTLFASSAGIFIVPVVYAFSRSLYTVAASNLLMGAIFSGVNLSLFNALLDATPETNRATYIAYYQTLVNVSAILAPMAGVAFLNAFDFRWAFLLSALFRILGSLAFLFVDRLQRRDAAREAAELPAAPAN